MSRVKARANQFRLFLSFQTVYNPEQRKLKTKILIFFINNQPFSCRSPLNYKYSECFENEIVPNLELLPS